MEQDIFKIQDNLLASLEKAAESLGASPGSVTLEKPKDPAHGDFASPIALSLAKKLKKPPMVLAEEILKNLQMDPDLVQGVETAPPGFLNIRLKPKVLYAALENLLSQDRDYGKNLRLQGQKLLLEFVSANPTGPLNIVSARAAALGDSIANLQNHSGAQVLKEYYVNDAGVQSRLFGESLEAALSRVNGTPKDAPENGYQGAYMEDLAKTFQTQEDEVPNPSFNLSSAKLGRWGMDQVLQWHRDSLEAYGVYFDSWFSEQKQLHDPGLVASTVEDLKKAGLTYEKDGALWMRVSEFGAPKDEVLVKSDGLPAYFAADIAYHIHKFKRGFTKLVDIWGPDHHGHILRMVTALKAAGFPAENFTVLTAQQVNLLEGGEKVKMSKREGKFVTMDELLEKVGKDAARFFFVMRSPNSHLDFDIEIARKQTEENPVFYIQYAHARICSLLKKTAEKGFKPATHANLLGPLTEPEAFLLLKEILEYPQWVVESAKAYEPHRLVAYLQNLAALFHVFYAKHRILDAPKETAEARLGLALGVRVVIRNALGLLGVSAPEQM